VSDTGDKPDGRNPVDKLIDALIFAPLEGLLEAASDIEGAAAKGRKRLELQLSNARVLGKMAVTFGGREIERRARDLLTPDASSDGVGPIDERDPEDPEPEPAHPDVNPVDHLIPGYDDLSASQVVRLLGSFDDHELAELACYERAVRKRRTILNRIDQLSTPGDGSS